MVPGHRDSDIQANVLDNIHWRKSGNGTAKGFARRKDVLVPYTSRIQERSYKFTVDVTRGMHNRSYTEISCLTDLPECSYQL
jgi:hypothetical protein